MSIKEELLFDFALNMPRMLVTGNTAVLDNVKKVMLLTDSKIVVYNGHLRRGTRVYCDRA